MKKLLLGSCVLLIFACALFVLQVSCSKTVVADPPKVVQLNRLIYFKAVAQSIGPSEIWISDYDGSNASKVNVTLPGGYFPAGENGVKLSPDGKTIFFVARETVGSGIKQHIYSCGVDGSNPKKIIEGTDVNVVLTYLGGAY